MYENHSQINQYPVSQKTLRYDAYSNKNQYFEKLTLKKPAPMYIYHFKKSLTLRSFKTINPNKNSILFSFKNCVKTISPELQAYVSSKCFWSRNRESPWQTQSIFQSKANHTITIWSLVISFYNRNKPIKSLWTFFSESFETPPEETENNKKLMSHITQVFSSLKSQ